MATVTLFKNRFGPVNVSTPNGEVLKFAAGRYFTRDKDHEAYLRKLAEKNECGVFIDPNEKTVDTENLDPMAAMKAKMRAELMEEIKAGKHNIAAKSATGNTENEPLQNSTNNTFGAATPQGTPVSGAHRTVQAASEKQGDTGTIESAPSRLEQLKKGSQGSQAAQDAQDTPDNKDKKS